MIHYQVYKNQNTTKWVTFVHGAGGSSSIWFKQIRAFKKIFNALKNEAFNGKKFEIKDNTNLRTRKPFNKSLFEELRKKHKV